MLDPDTVHHSDCFAGMTQLPDESVDVVLTDPPYPNGMDLFSTSLVDGLAALYFACKKARHFVVFFWNPQDVPPAPPGWFEVARHVWHKPDCKSITHYESVVVWSRESRRKMSRVWSIPILDYRSLKDWKPHPTQKPVKLIRYLLDLYTNEGDTVLDPFVGSGTTIVACLQTGRHCIAIEHNPEYAQIANERVKELLDRRTEASSDPESAAEEVPKEGELTADAPARAPHQKRAYGRKYPKRVAETPATTPEPQ